MEPEARERLAGEGLGLGNFVFVMRKDKVFAAGVQVEAFPQHFHGHDGALDMPARAAGADDRVPGSLAGLGRLPQSEVAGAVFVVFVEIHPRAVFHAGKIFFGKLAVGGEFGDAEIVGAVIGAVGEPLLDQALNELGHFLDVIGRANQDGLADVEIGGVFKKSLLVLGGVLLDAEMFAGGAVDDFVVHVGDVHDVADLIAALQQEAMQDVHGNHGAQVADVNVVVHRGPAGIHADFVVLRGSEGLGLGGERVVEMKWHGGQNRSF